MALTITKINTMPSEDKERARKLDARTFTNQPNRMLTADEIKKKLAIPTEVTILESERLVGEINSAFEEIDTYVNEKVDSIVGLTIEEMSQILK